MALEKVKNEFHLHPFGQKGWLYNEELNCPHCQKKGKFGFLLYENNGIVHCFKCDYKTSLYTYLKSINKLNLIGLKKSVQSSNKLQSIRKNLKNYIKESKKNVNLPYGFKIIDRNAYLNARGFSDYHYKLFTPGYTDSIIENRLNNYIIFVLYQDQQISGWLARSKYSKEWHENNLQEFKKGNCDLKLRYINASIDFGNIIGGYDELSSGTETVLIVEGLFDKVNVDNKLKLYYNERVKCIFTFGNKISNQQISLLQKKEIKKVILLYDYNTIEQSKKYGLILSKYFYTEICTIQMKDLDPGDASYFQLYKILKERKVAHQYFVSMIGNKLIKND